MNRGNPKPIEVLKTLLIEWYDRPGGSIVSPRYPQVTLNPRLLVWARKRAGLAPDELAGKVGVKSDRVYEWETTGRISTKQVENVARHTYTPLGFLYLQESPDDQLPIPDFRASRGRAASRPSPDLLDTVYTMQRRQDWIRDELIEKGEDRLAFVGSRSINDDPVDVAHEIRSTLGVRHGFAHELTTWSQALTVLRDRIEQIGVFVVLNGVVGNNTHRQLDPEEFQGFALADDHAPFIFVNNADYLAAKIFTLIHELAHIWIGSGGVSVLHRWMPADNDTERFCNTVSAEFLVPRQELTEAWSQVGGADRFNQLARRFKVSRLVVARRALDTQHINREEFFEFYNGYVNEERSASSGSGGDFWNNQNVRVGRRFGRAVVTAVKEGRLLYSEAYSLTGLRGATFDAFIGHVEG